MIKDEHDSKSPDVEDEGEMQTGRDTDFPTEFPPQQSWRRRVCPGARVLLILLGLLCVIFIAAAVFGASGHRVGTDLQGMEEGVRSANHTVSVATAALKRTEAENWKTLKKIEEMVKNLTQLAEHEKSQFQDQISKTRAGFRALNCELESTKHNKTGNQPLCCPPGWASLSQSCYWLSSTQKSWNDAKLDCEDRDAHLAIISGYVEQEFVARRTKPRYTWIGLTFTEGNWKWVDGTLYTIRRINWRPGEPDHYSTHSRGEPAHCGYLYRDGLWSDEHCARQYNWVCEMEPSKG